MTMADEPQQRKEAGGKNVEERNVPGREGREGREGNVGGEGNVGREGNVGQGQGRGQVGEMGTRTGQGQVGQVGGQQGQGQQGVGQQGQLKCNQCGQNFTSQGAHQEHMRTTHGGNR
jgi:hypothetical protein